MKRIFLAITFFLFPLQGFAKVVEHDGLILSGLLLTTSVTNYQMVADGRWPMVVADLLPLLGLGMLLADPKDGEKGDDSARTAGVLLGAAGVVTLAAYPVFGIIEGGNERDNEKAMRGAISLCAEVLSIALIYGGRPRDMSPAVYPMILPMDGGAALKLSAQY